MRFPPPDPHESRWEPPRQMPLPASTAVFAAGPPSPEADRLADRILDVRPGLLVVLAHG